MIKKRLTALVLAGVLTLTPALAADSNYRIMEYFPSTAEYPGYPDVAEGDWFYENAKLCYEVGLMTGTEAGFEPAGRVSQGEIVVILARMHARLNGRELPQPGPGDPWYGPAAEYLTAQFQAGALPSSYLIGTLDQLAVMPEYAGYGCTRAGFASSLASVVPDQLLTPINAIERLPDTDDEDALRLYNAGILTGTDDYGTFHADGALTRAEVAAMLSRVVRPELRMHFVPADYSPFAAAGMTPETEVFPGVSAGAFLNAVNGAIYNYEVSLRRAGVEFNWHYVDVDEKTVLDGVKEQTLSNLGVSAEAGTEAYRDFDYQVYYSRLIDLMGGPLGAEEAPGAGA